MYIWVGGECRPAISSSVSARGLAVLAIPTVALTNAPQRFTEWLNTPPIDTHQVLSDDAASSRPLRGYVAGEPTPSSPTPAPTLGALGRPESIPTRAPAPAAPASADLSSLRWGRTGMIRSGGQPVMARRVPGVESGDDTAIADGSPVLVSTAAPLQVGTDQWRAIRGLNGVVGWVLATQLAIDGEVPPQPIWVAATAVSASVNPTPVPASSRATIANTDGVGVVLRNSPNDADRTRSGLMDGVGVTVLEYAGQDWAHVKADNGQVGWVPARYVVPGG